MNQIKSLLSVLWKAIPRTWQWRALWMASDRFVAGVTGVVFNARGEVLVAHHVYRSGIVWGLPGGGIKHGESLERAMHREILEETGISVRVNHLLQVNLDKQWPSLNFYLACTAEGTPQPQVNGELFEASFYPLDDLSGIVDPAQWIIIQRAVQVRQQPELARTIPTGVEGNVPL